VSGYADPRGSKEYNTALSKDRAESVAAVLTNAGLDKDRVVIEALGANGASETGDLDDYAFQRRVSVKLLGSGDVPDATKSAASTVAQVQ
jgi:outer membrane protein OmpA-like peptidoglycan-associated protein